MPGSDQESWDAVRAREAAEIARSLDLIGGGVVATAVLKRTRKTFVVRLLQERRPPIVAKWGSVAQTATEVRVYREVLPGISGGYVSLLGSSNGPIHGWLFLEDAGDVALDGADPRMRQEVGRLLGRMVSETSGTNLEGMLPAYTLQYFVSTHSDARRRLTTAPRESLDASSRRILAEGERRLDLLESLIPDVAAVFSCGSQVLCHADIKSKNVRFVGADQRPVLLDWELAGRGPTLVDLGCLEVAVSDDPFLRGFARMVGSSGQSLIGFAYLGRVLRMIHAMDWAARELAWSTAARGVRRIESYCRSIDDLANRVAARRP